MQKITIEFEEAQDYQVGNFINALDEVVCVFDHYDPSTFARKNMADAMEMYANHLRKEDP